MLKIIFIASLSLFSLTVFSQDPATTLNLFDGKVYTLKNKGVKEFVVDISSSKLNQNINTLGTFGNVKNLFFRVYWTLAPERLDIEVMGLPEGFKEVKEDLKLSVLGLLENIIPPPTEKKFAGYKFSTIVPGQLLAKDTTGVADIPTFIFKFDQQSRLVEMIGQKPVGTIKVSPIYEKESFSDGRWVLKKQVTVAQENGQENTTVKTLSYGSHDGLSVLKNITINTEQKNLNQTASKAVSISESIDFKNYKINQGDALKHFMKDLPIP